MTDMVRIPEIDPRAITPMAAKEPAGASVGAPPTKTPLIQALSRLAGNRQSDGVSSLVSCEDRQTIIDGCHALLLASRQSDTGPEVAALRGALEPLVAIADAYDNNELDDEARKFWGINLEHQNETPPAKIELFTGRGGKRLLTLADCIAARRVVKSEVRT